MPELRECLTLEERVFSVKKRFLGMCRDANAAHIGSSLSCAELLVFLRFAWMTDDDRFVLSKGHAAAALYAVLAEARLLTQEQLESFHREGTRLPAHPPINAFEQIPFATGSLGYGLSVSAGMALGAVLKREERRYFCVTSDGELDEGSVWEAALFIGHRRLTNVVWLIDRNRIQAFGRTEEVMALEPLDAKLRAFGFHVITVDGHDFSALLAARDESSRVLERRDVPVVILADTVKGNGVSFLRDTVDSHYRPLDEASYERALTELTRAHESALAGYRDAR
jgi:transketolase